uniref:Twisted gastrulation BMP signaling modulator 1 n=2 Tax=Haemonchus TaxID=6288 RepID=A0A0N4X7J3_HAEPC
LIALFIAAVSNSSEKHMCDASCFSQSHHKGIGAFYLPPSAPACLSPHYGIRVPKMFQKILLCVLLVIALASFVSADFSCFFGDFICKSVTCRKCTVATCLNGDCVCTLCS